MARSVNFVWNYLNELSAHSIRERGLFLPAYDIQKYTNGYARELGLHSHTVQIAARNTSPARGRWYVKRQCSRDAEVQCSLGQGAVDIDLGLRDVATGALALATTAGISASGVTCPCSKSRSAKKQLIRKTELYEAWLLQIKPDRPISDE